MKRTIAVAAAIFAIAAFTVFKTNLIGAAGEPLIVFAMGGLFIGTAKWMAPPAPSASAEVTELHAAAA